MEQIIRPTGLLDPEIEVKKCRAKLKAQKLSLFFNKKADG